MTSLETVFSMKRLKLLAITVLAIACMIVPIMVTQASAGATRALPEITIAATKANPTAANPNVAMAMRFYEIYNDRSKLGTLPELFAPDYVGKVNGRKIPDIKAAKGFISAFQTGFPDALYVVEDTIVSGDKVVMRWSCTGTHEGKFLGIDPTGQSIEITGITIFQFNKGKISRLWNNWDTFGLIQQLRGA
jgi:steroid delta-isomerase-like uncharacterized protein